MYNFDEIIDRRNTQCVKWDGMQEVFGSEDLLPLWVADMDFKTPDFVIQALRKRLDHEVLGYQLRPRSFFESAQAWLRRRNGWEVGLSELAFLPGVVPALSFAVQAFTRPGDKILIQPPVYHPFRYAVQDHGRELLCNPLREDDGVYSVDFEDFEAKLALGVRMFILCNPHNPVAKVWSEEDLRRMGALCCKYGALILSDEIHSDLVFNPHKHVHIAALSEAIAQQTLTFFAPSKTFNLGGMFTSVAHSANRKLLHTLTRYMEKMHLFHGSIFGDICLEAAYNHGDAWLDALLDYLSGNFDYVVQYLQDYVPGIKTRRPEGTYLMWLDARGLGLSPEALQQKMIAAGLGFNSGDLFGEEGAGFLRLNAACPRQRLEQACERLRGCLR